jgi:DNA repair protein RecO (recombination protein O)
MKNRFVRVGSGENSIASAIFHSSSAIVLRSRIYGESDKIVTFLTRDLGKVAAIAKGALRSRRRFIASLEPFTHIRLGLRLRPQAELGFVESADIVRAPRNVTRDLDRYAYSTYILEVIDCMVEGREAEPAIFDLTEEMLQTIDVSHPQPPSVDWLRYFETRLLGLTGFEPHLDRCARCAAPAPISDLRFYFNPRNGNLLCERCSEGSGLGVSAPSIDAILRLRNRPLAEAGPLPPSVAGEIRVLLQTFLSHHLRRPLRSPALLREILGV